MERRRDRETAQSSIDPSPTATRSSLATRTDAGTIQIMLDIPTAQEQSLRGPNGHETGYEGHGFGMGNAASGDLLPVQYTKSNGWESPWTPSRSDGDAASQVMNDNDYSAISRILDQYHQSGVVSPTMVHEFLQYILDVDPDLLGTDEAEKQSVAKTALEDIIRDHTLRLQESPSQQQVTENNWPASDGRSSMSLQDQDQDSESVFESSGASATDSDTAIPSQSIPMGTSGYQESSETTAPPPPPKDKYPSDRGAKPYASLNINTAQDSSTDLTMDRPTLPQTPVTGGSIGFLPNGALFGEITGQKHADNTTNPDVESHVNSIIPIITQPASPEHEEDPTTATAPYGHEPYDTSYSTPASSTREAPSISDSQQVPSSKTSLMDSAASESTLSATNTSPAPNPEQKRLNRRYQVLKELLDTEASYIQDMKVVEDIYKETSEHCIAISADDRRVLFGVSKEIIKFSETFLSALKKAAAAVYVLPRNNKWRSDGRGASFSTSTSSNGADEPPVPTSDFNDAERDSKTYIGQVFNEHMLEMEELYSTYLRNHDFANQRLKRLQEVPRVKLWLTECHSYAGDITSAWDLDSLLVKPVQRILKYPLLLKALIETTPDAHPDFASLATALTNMTDASVRINEAKKRAEVLEAMMTNNKRKEFDISKLLGRRTDKLRQQVGLSDAVDDTEYRKLAQKFETRYVHLQIVMRDFGVYRDETEKFMARVEDLMSVVEENIAVGRTEAPELESKWRKLVTTFREMQTYAWRDHDADVTKRCIDPIVAVIRLYEGPQRMMMKRKKRVVEYARYMTARNKGEKLDKKTIEQGEQFMALNETLKSELPRLFELSNQLVWACLRSFVNLQVSWHSIWQRKMRTILEETADSVPQIDEILEAFNSDFNYVEAHVLSLGVCNGSLLNDVNNFLSSSASTFSTSDTTSTTRPSYNRSSAASGTQSPRIPAPEFDRRSGSGFNIPSFSGRTSSESQHRAQQQQHAQSYYQERFRANSNVSNSGRDTQTTPKPTPYVPHQQRAGDLRPQRSQPQSQWQQPQPAPRASPPPPYLQPQSQPKINVSQRPASASTFYSTTTQAPPTGSTPNLGQQRQTSDAFSSAMPLSDSPHESRPVTPDAAPGQRELRAVYKVLFTAASLYDFNLKQDRYEAGYPYLFYSPGEIFDIIGTKGELWLARNQDDHACRIGWVWEKHFAKLSADV